MRILCYGDSNTWGYIPGVGTRYKKEERWTGILESLTKAEVIEEGMCGRTTVFGDYVEPFCNGMKYIAPCVLSHVPLDDIVIMLGTNDSKRRYHVSAREIRYGMEEVILRIRETLARVNETARIVIISPPQIYPLADSEFDEFSREKVKKLQKEYQELAELLGCSFLNSSEVVEQVGCDGIHLTKEDHKKLAEAVAEMVSAA